MMDEKQANIVEIFSSIQGEGLYVGQRHIFVRFGGCNLGCNYCDTPALRDGGGGCRVEPGPGQEPELVDNPVSAADLAKMVAALNRPSGVDQAVSLTGGEPLLAAAFLAHALPLIRQQGLPVYLETNGTLPDALAGVLDLVDIVAMDIKIPTATGQPGQFEANRRFLAVAVQKRTFAKVVFGPGITGDELDGICSVILSVDRPVSLVLQPITARNGVEAPDGTTILRVHQTLSARLPDVRVIPQIHPLLGFK